MDELTLFNSNMTELQREAVETHYEIRKNAEITATALTEFCKGLKKMRDKKLYAELGCETFEEYAKKFFGLAQRQAYNYIQALENLGEPLLQSNANLGITKLKILSEIPRLECAEFIENNDVADMSARELKEAIDKLTKANEQITFLSEENKKLTEENEALSEAEEDALQAEQEKENLEKYYQDMLQSKDNELVELKKSLKEAQERPVAVSVREPSEEELKKLTSTAVSKAKKAAKEEKEKAVAEVEAKAKKQLAELEAKYKDVISTAEKDKADIAAKLADVEKNSKVSANPDVLKFSVYYEAIQKNIAELKKIVALVDEDTAQKLKNALDAVAQMLKDI